MKLLSSLLLVCCLWIVESIKISDLTSVHLNNIANMEAKLLPVEFQLKSKDNSHWCCKNDMPVNTIQRTKIDSEIHTVSTKIKIGYTNCGFLGSKRCTLWGTRYKHIAKYFIATYEVPDEQMCPDHHLVCCRGFLQVAGQCHDAEFLNTHLGLITDLNNMGLLDG